MFTFFVYFIIGFINNKADVFYEMVININIVFECNIVFRIYNMDYPK